MKPLKLLFLGILFIFSNSLFAQKDRVNYLPNFDKKKLHYGFYLGVNQNDFKIDYKTSNYANANISVTATSGFNVGLIADLRLHKNINVRFEPGLISNTKTLAFTHINSKQDSIREIGSTYLHIPFVFKFSTDRMDNVRPYLLAGVSYDYNFSSNQRNANDNSGGEFRMKTHNFMYEVGIGIDIYLYFFKFSPSIRGVFAMNNELKYDDSANSQWTSPVNFLGTRGVFLNFAFE
ncbi:type IX secretion/gliding motility protein PorT/SprT [Polaribacter gochangensis]|uniref:type IX secretion/gliding motility protein PorT/SprT n=1 Tax=Polaribacter gochangensis TaxID=3252903 RepID=UPI0039047594